MREIRNFESENKEIGKVFKDKNPNLGKFNKKQNKKSLLEKLKESDTPILATPDAHGPG